MATEPMGDYAFEQLLSSINQETHSTEKKLERLFTSRGYFSAHQASRILYAFGIPADKIKAIEIMEPRLSRMSCSEARDVIGAVSIHNDKINALQCIKRYLGDCQTREGTEQILSCFPFENDKMMALRVLGTVRSDVHASMPAGGHQGYAALGGLYTQCRPLVPHLYGSVADQQKYSPGFGNIEVPVEAKQGLLPSMYTGHPSYAYPQGRDYAEDRGYPGNSEYQHGPSSGGECPARPALVPEYPSGAPPLGMHHGGAYPTGFSEMKVSTQY